MLFYCPVCVKTVDLNSETTLTTMLNQCVYKAHCPTCNQDLACTNPEQATSTQNSLQENSLEVDPQVAVNQALNEFGASMI